MVEQSALGKVLNQKYRLSAELGRGAMGIVYRADQLDVEGHVQRQVALKTMIAELSANPDFARRFLQEIRITMTLNNPHIITVYDSGRDESGQLYFTMELVSGQSLRELLRQEGMLSVERTLHITGQICEALAEAHSLAEPIVHRDLKPENIFVAQRHGKDWVKVGDFGIAKVLGENNSGLTHTGMSPGTPRYMAPEQCLGNAVDTRTDLYALGIMLYEMLVGHTPFRADSVFTLLRKHVEEPPPPLPETLPFGVRSQVKQLLAKAPSDRPSDALGVRHALEHGRLHQSELSTVILAVQDSQIPELPVPAATTAQSLAVNSQLLADFVGRERELQQLQGWYEKTLQGERQIVFVTGEPGMGKTTLVESFDFGVQSHEKFEVAERLKSKIQSPQLRTPPAPSVGGNPELFPNSDSRPPIPDPWLARGQCIAQYGAGEAYLPILEALGQLGRASAGDRLRAVLRQQAPSWLVQLPSLLQDTELDELQRRVQGVTKERMLRELAEALEVLTSDHPLVLVLEDLHWCDPSTLDLLAYLAQRRQPARLLVVGTYRPTDVAASGHPLLKIKQELQAHKQCEELRLALLTEPEVTAYIAQRFPTIALPAPLGHVVHERSDGNALFMVNLVEELIKQQVIVEESGQWELRGDIAGVSVPDTLRQLIEKQLGQLSDDQQQVLEVASVAGTDFPVAAVAAGLKQDADQIEEVCEAVAKHGHFLEERGIIDWPDGTLSGRYSFRHALYQSVLYDRLAHMRRVRMHRQIGERLEAGYGERAKEVAAELAVHFEQGRDFPRAIQYLEHAGRTSVQRSAHREAIVHLTKGLELLKTLPDTLARAQQELMFQLPLAVSLIAIHGYAAPEVEATFRQARTLCQQLGDTPQLIVALSGIAMFHLARAELRTGRELAEQILRLADTTNDSAFAPQAHGQMAYLLYYLGEIEKAREHSEHAIRHYNHEQHHALASLYGQDPGVASRSQMAWDVWILGYPEQALKWSVEAVSLARELAHPSSLALALHYAAYTHQYRRDSQAALQLAEELLHFAHEQGLPFWLALATCNKGIALAGQLTGPEGVMTMRQGLAMYQALGAEVGNTYFLARLAESEAAQGKIEEGIKVLTQAFTFIDNTGEEWGKAELYRLKGQLTLQKGAKNWGLVTGATSPRALTPKPQDLQKVEQEAEECFLKAIEVAQKQQAKSLELRATVSLARLWQQQGKQQEAYAALSEIYNWFTEGFDTKDLQAAKALLAELSH